MADTPAAGGDGLRQTFTRKLGPLPVWAWATLAVAAIVGYMYWKHVGIFAPGSALSGSSAGSDSGTATDAGGGGGGLFDSLGGPSYTGPAGYGTQPGQGYGGGGANAPTLKPGGVLTPGPDFKPYSGPAPIIGLGAPPGSSSTPSGNGAFSSAGTNPPIVAAPNPTGPRVSPSSTAGQAASGYVAPTAGQVAAAAATISPTGRRVSPSQSASSAAAAVTARSNPPPPAPPPQSVPVPVQPTRSTSTIGGHGPQTA